MLLSVGVGVRLKSAKEGAEVAFEEVVGDVAGDGFAELAQGIREA